MRCATAVASRWRKGPPTESARALCWPQKPQLTIDTPRRLSKKKKNKRSGRSRARTNVKASRESLAGNVVVRDVLKNVLPFFLLRASYFFPFIPSRLPVSLCHFFPSTAVSVSSLRSRVCFTFICVLIITLFAESSGWRAETARCVR